MEKLEAAVGIKWVDGIAGVRVLCGNIPCVFEFVTYKYKVAPPSDDHSQTSDTSSGVPSEEPDLGGFAAQPKNGREPPESGVLTDNGTNTPTQDISQQDIHRIKEKIQSLPRPPPPIMVERRSVQGPPQASQQRSARSPTRFIQVDSEKNQPRVLNFPSWSSSNATITKTTITRSDSTPIHVGIQTTPTTAITTARDSISSSGDVRPNGSDPPLSDNQVPNNNAVPLQSDQLWPLRRKPNTKRPVVVMKGEQLSPTNYIHGVNSGPTLGAQSHIPSGGFPQHVHEKASKNSPVNGALLLDAPRHRPNGGSGFRSQMNLDPNAICEQLSIGGGEKNSSNEYDNDAAASIAINGVDNGVWDTIPKEGSGHSTEV